MNPDQFTQQVLGALQLNACEQAHTLLDDYTNDLLTPFHDELIRQHLKNCGECRALHSTMAMMNAELPALQSLRAPKGFTAAVMQRTVQHRVVPPVAQKPSRTIAWLMRPRVALESAYAMTVVIMLFSGLTGVNAFDAGQINKATTALWQRTRPRLAEPPRTLQQFSTQIFTTYDNTADVIQIWTQEKYAAITEQLRELKQSPTFDSMTGEDHE